MAVVPVNRSQVPSMLTITVGFHGAYNAQEEKGWSFKVNSLKVLAQTGMTL